MNSAPIPFPLPEPKKPKPSPKKRERNVVRVGTVKVRWYRLADGRTMVDPRKYARKLASFSNHEEAIAHATAIALEINAGGTEVLALTAKDRAAYAQACAAAEAHGCDLGSAIHEWKELRKQLAAAGPVGTLSEVVSAGIQVLLRPEFPTLKVVEQFLATKAGKDFDGRHKRDLKGHLEAFAAAFPGHIGGITPEQIEEWLGARKKRDGEPLGPKRRNDVLSNVRSLFIFARSREMLPDRITAAHKVEERDLASSTIDVLSVAEMQRLMELTGLLEKDWVPMIALAGFSGMRVEELSLSHQAADRKDVLRWEDLDWDSGEIVVREAVAKNKTKRRLPIAENLAEWLSPWREKNATGRIVTGNMNRFRPRFRLRLEKLRLAEAAEIAGVSARDVLGLDDAEREALFAQTTISPRLIDWPHNALRHSYGSNRMAIIRNKHTLAYEMGSSVQMIDRHYHNPRPIKEAQAWFEIRPLQKAKAGA